MRLEQISAPQVILLIRFVLDVIQMHLEGGRYELRIVLQMSSSSVTLGCLAAVLGSYLSLIDEVR